MKTKIIAVLLAASVSSACSLVDLRTTDQKRSDYFQDCIFGYSEARSVCGKKAFELYPTDQEKRLGRRVKHDWTEIDEQA